jgi:MerR family transcriptional regulator/heat shock protein HspR
MRNTTNNNSRVKQLDLRDINKSEARRSANESYQKALSNNKLNIDDSPEESEGVYIISVAAKILAMHPQTLRKYERTGLISPSRTTGMLRLYSGQDIDKIKLIKYLVDDIGMNLSGVGFVLDTFDELYKAKKSISNIYNSPNSSQFHPELQHLLSIVNKPFSNIKQSAGKFYE